MKRIDDITLMVEGIPCSGCAMDVETILLGMDSIDTVDFSISINTIKILYDTGEIKVDHLINRQENRVEITPDRKFKEMKPAVYPGLRSPVTERNVYKNTFLDNHSYIFY